MAVNIGAMTGVDSATGNTARRAALKRRLRAYLEQKRMREQQETVGGAAGLAQLVAFLRQQNKPPAEMSPARRTFSRQAALLRILRGIHGPYNTPMAAPRPDAVLEAGGAGFDVDGEAALSQDELNDLIYRPRRSADDPGLDFLD